MTEGKAREMARDLVRGSIIEDAAAQFIEQILKHAVEERIKPLQARAEAAEAEVEKLRGALAALEKAASEVSRRGAETGPQWSKLTIALLSARAALTTEERHEG